MAEAAPSAPLVLVVDDTPINGAVVSMLLGQLGCRALAVGSGAEALTTLAAHAVDLVLMDCQMPGMDGFETTQRIRQVPGRRVPIVALTAYDQPEDRARCLAAGMDDLLAKPLQLATLRAALARWLPDRCAQIPSTAATEGDAVLDHDALASFDRMRPGSSATLLGIYLKDLAVAEKALAQAIADGDLSTVARLAHKLKGASLTVGARALGAAMKAVEVQARQGCLPATHERWQRAAAVLAETRATITARCQPQPPPASPWPTGRASGATIAEQRARVLGSEGLSACLEAMPLQAMLLNEHRQIVAVNGQFQRTLGVSDANLLIGKRPGEAVGCVHAEEGPDGCGSAYACSFCGAVQAIVAAQQDQSRTARETRLTIGPDSGHALDLEITATPIHLAPHRFVLLAMRDIASEKRRQVLERIFFHDVLNSAGGINGLATQLAQRAVPAGDEAAMRALLARTTQQLVEEIDFQRLLSRAETGELHVDLQSTDLEALLREVHDAGVCLPVARQRTLALGSLAAATLRTDRVLFRRVLGNLVKNALEATPPGGTVTIASRRDGGRVLCTVHNPGVMPPEVQAQLFQRSFTTKGAGRGLGTWSARLLGERGLGGQLTFTSTAEAGTELVFALPLDQ